METHRSTRPDRFAITMQQEKHRMFRLMAKRVALMGAALASVAALSACDNGAPGGGTGIRGIDKFAGNGPERVTMQRVVGCTRFLPPMGSAGSRGGLGWANGTGAAPGQYSGILNRVASFGTLVVAANTTNSGTGREVDTCIDQLDAARADSSGRFAASGHSQGGSGSINASRLNDKVVVTCPVQMDGVFTAQSDADDIRGTRTGPALIMCGESDVSLAPCQRAGNGDSKFNQTNVPITRISVVGAGHLEPTGGGGLYAALVTTCVEAAVGGDADASAALQPGGANGGRGLARVASRNF
jgi:hypothetical protein